MNTSILPPYTILAYGAVIGLLMILAQTQPEALKYMRDPILSGEVWRLLTANFTHTNHNHLYLNLAGFILFILLCGSSFSVKFLNFSIIFTAVFITSALLLFHPSIQWYVGFSGVLYGLFVTGAVMLAIHREYFLVAGIAALGLFKLIGIWQTGSSTSTEQLINARVLYEAHGYGVIAGLLCLLPILLKHLFTQNKPSK